MNGPGRRGLWLAGLLALTPALLAAGDGEQGTAGITAARLEESVVSLDVEDAVTALDVEEAVEPMESEEAEGSATTVIIATDVLFEFDEDVLSDDAEATLGDLAERLADAPGTVRVVGHSDGLGADDYNQDLSERRAETVRDALVELLGDEAPEIEASGRGSDEPVAEETDDEGNDLPAGRSQNRRVEITFEGG
ncbi:OmpA family protein [Marinactinospora rubrisoli]|uniref:OmpA family protein n=1 Tax=Marinactinospora rubrisoli TaxID=2715399 RepID=A0ABW2KEN1_9ACTN